MKTLERVRSVAVQVLAVTLILPTVACQQPTAEGIVARVAEAMSSSEDIETLTTLRVRTVYTDHEYPVISEFRRPNKLRTEGAGNYVLVFDGEQGAFLERPPAEDGTPQGPELIDPDYAKDLELDVAYVFPAFFDHPSEYLGVEMVDGVAAHELRVVLPLGVPLTYYIDAETYVPLRVVADVTVDGTEYHPELVYGDYRESGGIVYAHTFTVSWVPDDVDTALVELVEVNVPLDDDRFTIPADIK
jgi:hypothetical protein